MVTCGLVLVLKTRRPRFLLFGMILKCIERCCGLDSPTCDADVLVVGDEGVIHVNLDFVEKIL